MRRAADLPWLPLLAVTLLGSIVLSFRVDQFLTSYNIFVILQGAATYAVIGFAAMVVLVVRDISLAVGGIGAVSGVLFGWLVADQGMPVVPAAIIALVGGAVAGLANGLLITRTKLNGFIVTLATGALLTGLAIGATKSAAFAGIPRSWTAFGQGRIWFFPLIGLVTAAVAAALFVLYRSTRPGRAMLTAGGNPEAALLVGIDNSRQVVLAHVLSGVLAAIAALLTIGRIGSAPPDLGTDWVLISFAVPIIGGTALAGGVLSVGGALVAALVLAIIDNALVLLSVSPYGIVLAQGLLILVAILLGNLSRIVRRRPRLQGAT
ncbi:ABC transporter permease [Nakamurella flavida]|uniref:Autoinducer 2 import system permease protein LsrD n=1 Tax=Nakamurella flavida TaxID=363630 RepID=A0A938YIS2_9ACTN|nr:ABC transporter permease [Nakamurella flavida]MBM9476722.1 ABC transporter permease [Nakamurella flavida]MDP9778840.1 ribose transport system permease protein [Nakamurella flavida]